MSEPIVATKVRIVDRDVFFSKIRQTLFGGKLTQLQVDGMNCIIDEWEKRKLQDERWLAYILATAYHETDKIMQPLEEYGKGRGKKYGIPNDKTGKIYYGRGIVQVTWYDNYEKFEKLLKIPLTTRPELMLQPEISVLVAFEGMLFGLFTGRKLADYFDGSKSQPTAARRIINALDKADLIGGFHNKFLEAITF